MATAAYTYWVTDGEPYRDAQPVADLATTLRWHGYTVYTRGDTSHMTASTPEDHTPFSYTGWPIDSAYGVGHALDVMPPPVGKGLPSIAQLGAQIVRDRTNLIGGTEPIKYMNWTDASGNVVQDSWTGAHRQNSSSDAGHIHISVRSDMDESPIAGNYDPVRRWLNAQEDTMDLADSLKPFGGLDTTVGRAFTTLLVRTDALANHYSLSGAAAKIDALTAAVGALATGGSSVDTAAVIAAVHQVGDQVETLAAELAASQTEAAELRAKLAVALAA
jgi:hypothetical protein